MDAYENTAGGRTGWDDTVWCENTGTFIPIGVKLCSLSFFLFSRLWYSVWAGNPHSVGGSYLLVFAHDFALRLGGGRHSFMILHTHVRLPAFSLGLSPAYGHLHSSSIIRFVLGFKFIGCRVGPRLGGEDERSHLHSYPHHPHPNPHSYLHSCVPALPHGLLCPWAPIHADDNSGGEHDPANRAYGMVGCV
jgi:hypothetical protein